ncbi:major histocompatibility complex class I-related gene protein-like isoform X2 [Sardina pilchardus]
MLVCGDISEGMGHRMLSLKDHFNKTHGIQTLQRLTGCELLGNDEEGRMVVMEAFDGESGDVVYYNKHESSFLTDLKWPIKYSEIYKNYVKYALKELFHPLCMKILRKYLRKEKNRIVKKVKPRVRLLQKADSGGAEVTCLATGFYPRHINLTLLRDGQPVSDHQVTGGELLPNGDETYQMRKSLEVSAEELQHHHYTCTAEHLSLDNMVKIIIEAEPHPDNLPPLSLLIGLLVVTIVCLISAIIVLGIWRWRKRRRRRSSSLSPEECHTSST